MAFWGIEVKPNKPYIHRPGDEGRRLHISQATLGSGSSTKKSIVQCKVGNKKPIYICTLFPEKLETSPLNLEFGEEDEVTFSVVGAVSVHLTGFLYVDDDQYNHEDEYGSDSYEEDVMVTDSDGDGDSSVFDSDDELDDDFIASPSHVPNSSVRIEEIVDDGKTNDDDGKEASKKRTRSAMSGNNANSNQQIVVKGDTKISLSESEDEDGFPIIKSKESIGMAVSEKVQEKNGKSDVVSENNLKQIITASKDGEHCRETIETCDSAAQSDKVKKRKKKKKVAEKIDGSHDGKPNSNVAKESPDIGNDVKTSSDMQTIQTCDSSAQADDKVKKKKKKKKKKVAEKIDGSQDGMPNSNGAKVSPVADIGNDLKTSSEINKEQEGNKKIDQEKSTATPNAVEKSVGGKGILKKQETREAKSLQVRSFPNGLVIEELEMGKPDGKRAAPGKKVSVHYIGKLKKDDKIFDSNIGKPPFKFRLGIGQVIKGWDVGVNGMRVGDKRRLTIPPAMGYGATGSSPKIPPNAWLVFDVVLVNVN